MFVRDKTKATRALPPGLPAQALLLSLMLMPLCLPAADARAQSPRSESATASISVQPVLQVEPAGASTLRFPATSRERPGGTGRWIEGAEPIRVRCAGNVRSRLTIRRSGSGGDETRVRWSADGGANWHPLTSEPRTVAEDRAPGRDGSCATIRFRAEPRSGKTGDAVPSVRYELQLDATAASAR